MKIPSSVKQASAAGGSRPIMRSVNILMTPQIVEALESGAPDSRSSAVRDAAEVVIRGYAKGHEWVIGVIKDRVDATSPRQRREDEEAGMKWEKAIVWIPETMLREIERLGKPNDLRVSEFLRGVVVYATENAKK
jgi:hypothetical protein